MKMREEDVVSSSVRRMAASTSQLTASVASRCAKNLATLRSCAARRGRSAGSTPARRAAAAMLRC
jgi:hypothetical protein